MVRTSVNGWPNNLTEPQYCCRILAVNADTEETMDTFLSPNSNGKYQVFFSHKEEDAKVTHCIKDLLDRHTENVNYFISENIEKGTNWRQTIAEQLTLSSFLVLVFTDPNEDWGWCLYETGFFDALTQNPGTTQARRQWSEVLSAEWRLSLANRIASRILRRRLLFPPRRRRSSLQPDVA